MAHTARQIYFKTLSLQKFQLQGEVPWTGTLEVINKTLFQLWVTLHWWSQVLTNLSNLLIVINSSVNIVIYAMKDFKFRQVRCAISNTWINVQNLFQEWDGSLIQRAFKRLLLPGKTVLFVCQSKYQDQWGSDKCNQFDEERKISIHLFWYHLSFIFPVAQLSKVHDRSLVTSSVANRFEPPSTGYLGGWYVISFKNLKDRTLVGSNTA